MRIIRGAGPTLLVAMVASFALSGCAGIGVASGVSSMPDEPACRFMANDGPVRPTATSRPLFAVATTSSWGSLRVHHPDVVVYDDHTIASLTATPEVEPSRSAGDRTAVSTPLAGYIGGRLLPCDFEQITAEFTELRGLDFGQTRIMDGSYTRIDMFGGPTLGAVKIGVDNLETDSEALTSDQRKARQRLVDWIDHLDTFVRAGELPVDQLVVLDGISGHGRLNTTETLPWTGPKPVFDNRCALLTGSAARQALADVGDGAKGERSSVFYATFAIDNVPHKWALVTLAPGFGCTFHPR